MFHFNEGFVISLVQSLDDVANILNDYQKRLQNHDDHFILLRGDSRVCVCC